LHLSGVALRNLNLLLAWAFSSSSWAFLATALFVGAADEFDLLVDLDWSEAYSVGVDVSVRFHSTVDSGVGKGVVDLKLAGFVSGWTWKSSFNVSSVHCFLDSIDMIKSWSFWRFLSCSLAFIVSSNSLGVTLNDHWLEWWNFFFIIVFIDISWWRIYTINNLTYILRSIIPLTLLRRVSSWIRLQFYVILTHWLINALFITQVIRKLILKNHLANGVIFVSTLFIEGVLSCLFFVIAEDDALGFDLVFAGDFDVVFAVFGLDSELFDAVGVHLKLLMTKFI